MHLLFTSLNLKMKQQGYEFPGGIVISGSFLSFSGLIKTSAFDDDVGILLTVFLCHKRLVK